MGKDQFKFKQFEVKQKQSAARVGTDGILLGAWVSLDPETEMRVLDVGTGTGLIALMIAQRAAGAKIDAIELHEDSAKEAAQNFKNSPWKKRLNPVQGDVRDPDLLQNEAYDLIVSNPPYFPGQLKAVGEEREMWRSGSHLDFGELVRVGARLIKPEGRLAVILPVQAYEPFMQLAAEQGWHSRRECLVQSRAGKLPVRFLAELGRSEVREKTNEKLVIYGREGALTWEYLDLVEDFYPWA